MTKGIPGNSAVGERKTTTPLCLDLGCGRTKPPGFIGVDLYEKPEVDVVHNLNQMPWPWEDESVDCVRFSRCVIHLKDIDAALQEVVRILKPGGLLWIVTGHPSHPESYAPSHMIPGFTLAGLASLTTIPKGGLSGAWHGRFELVDAKLYVDATIKYPWTLLARWFAIRRPYGYEQWFSWLAPIREIEWRARKCTLPDVRSPGTITKSGTKDGEQGSR